MNISKLLKKCNKCEEEYPATVEYFYAEKKGKYGLRGECRKCRNIYRRKFNKTPGRREYERKRSKTRKEYRDNYNHSEMGKASQKKYLSNPINMEKKRSYAKKRREKIEIKLRIKLYDQQPHIVERKRNYRKTERGKIVGRLSSWKRRRRLENSVFDFSLKDWSIALNYFNNKCAICGRSEKGGLKIVPDHWIPVCKGGSTINTNIIPLCHSYKQIKNGCNNSKLSQDFRIWLLSRYNPDETEKIIDRINLFFERVKNHEKKYKRCSGLLG